MTITDRQAVQETFALFVERTKDVDGEATTILELSTALMEAATTVANTHGVDDNYLRKLVSDFAVRLALEEFSK